MLEWLDKNVTKKYPRKIVRAGYAIEKTLSRTASLLNSQKEVFASVISFMSFQMLMFIVPGVIPGYLYALGVLTNYWNILMPYRPLTPPREVMIMNQLVTMLSARMQGSKMMVQFELTVPKAAAKQPTHAGLSNLQIWTITSYMYTAMFVSLSLWVILTIALPELDYGFMTRYAAGPVVNRLFDAAVVNVTKLEKKCEQIAEIVGFRLAMVSMNAMLTEYEDILPTVVGCLSADLDELGLAREILDQLYSPAIRQLLQSLSPKLGSAPGSRRKEECVVLLKADIRRAFIGY